MKRQIDEKEQQLRLNLPDDLPAVWADPSRLAQIFTNLVSNAIKYTPEVGEDHHRRGELYAQEDDHDGGVSIRTRVGQGYRHRHIRRRPEADLPAVFPHR